MKKIYLLLLTVIMLFSLAPAAFAEGEDTELRVSTPELEELALAVELGFGQSVDDESTVTYADYCAMLETLVDAVEKQDAIDRTGKIAAWKEKYVGIAEDTGTLNRINAMYMIYTLAHDVLGEAYDQPNCAACMPNGQTWEQLHAKIGNDVWNEIWYTGGCALNEGLFTDCFGGDSHPEYKVTFDSNSFDRQSAAYYYSFGRVSVSGWPLFEYDSESNSMRVVDPFTMREAMLSCLRLYESVDPFAAGTDFVALHADGVSTYRDDIITADLLERASYMPTPNKDSLPYYSGVHHDWINDDLTEADFRTYAELGFNYVRLDLTCKNFFGIGAEVKRVSDVAEGKLDSSVTAVDQVDMACLTRLDQAVSWGLKYGMHVSVQFSDYPGHIQFIFPDGSATADTDFYTNEEKQQQTAAMWELLAARYQGIPSSALSFIINHEPLNPGRSTGLSPENPNEEQVIAANTLLTNAIRAKDSTRFLFCQGGYDQCIDTYMADSQLSEELGLAQVANYAANEFAYWNLVTDASFSGGYFPDWPYYAIPSRLMYDGSDADYPSLTIDGDLPAGTRFDITMKSDADLTVTAENSSGGAVELTTATLTSTDNASDERSFTLPDGVSSLTLALIGNGCVDFQKFLITLPGTTYDKTQHYTNGTVRKPRTDSVLDVKLTRNNDNIFNHLTDTERALRPERCWVLNENAAADLTVTLSENACSYSSKYGYNQETLTKMAELYGAQRTQYGVEGMNFEFSAIGDLTSQAVNAYFGDLLTAFKENNIGWALYFAHTLYSDYYADTPERTPMDGSGLMVNNSLVDTLRANLGARPVIMVRVPIVAGDGGGGGGGGGGVTTGITVPASSDEGSVNVNATVSGGTALISATDAQIEQITADKKDAGTIKVDASALKVNEVTISTMLVDATATAPGSEGLEVILPSGSVMLDTTALESVGRKSITVSMEGLKSDDLTEAQKQILGDQTDTALVVDVSVSVNGVKTSDFGGGTISVSVPYTPKEDEDVAKLVVWYLNDDGSIEPMKGKYNSETKCYEFTTTHLSTYVLVMFPFTDDVAADSYYYSAVAWAVAGGITEGTSETTFGPGGDCTRAQMVTFLWRAQGSPEPTTTTCQFTDIVADSYYYKAVLWAAEKGYTAGSSDTTFSPDDPVTRAQVVAMEWRVAGKPAVVAVNPFRDVDAGSYYEEAVLWAVVQKITEGTTATTFSPDDACSRAQIVTLFYRYLAK